MTEPTAEAVQARREELEREFIRDARGCDTFANFYARRELTREAATRARPEDVEALAGLLHHTWRSHEFDGLKQTIDAMAAAVIARYGVPPAAVALATGLTAEQEAMSRDEKSEMADRISKAADFLEVAFRWHNSVQGARYWDAIHTNLECMENALRASAAKPVPVDPVAVGVKAALDNWEIPSSHGLEASIIEFGIRAALAAAEKRA